jgi:N-acetylmuramoyl-L-alanine amidase
MDSICLGDTGSAVRDIQRRLEDIGLPAHDPPGEFGPSTRQAVRAFQQQRGLVADGVVGPDTWRVLVEAGFSMGDRLLYRTEPKLRGDDVRELQQRLGQLGFDAGKDDGIFGPETESALMDFQINVGLGGDGKAGPDTFAILTRLHRTHQEVPATSVTERHDLSGWTPRPSLTGARILIDPGNSVEDPGYVSAEGAVEHEITWRIARLLQGRLAAAGAVPILSRGPSTSPAASDRAALANREDVEVVVSIQLNGLDTPQARGAAAYYFGSGQSVSDRGRRLSHLILTELCRRTGTPNCRAHRSTSAILRDCRAPAVAVEVGFLTNPEEGRLLADPAYQATVADSLTAALRAFLTGTSADDTGAVSQAAV